MQDIYDTSDIVIPEHEVKWWDDSRDRDEGDYREIKIKEVVAARICLTRLR